MMVNKIFMYGLVSNRKEQQLFYCLCSSYPCYDGICFVHYCPHHLRYVGPDCQPLLSLHYVLATDIVHASATRHFNLIPEVRPGLGLKGTRCLRRLFSGGTA